MKDQNIISICEMNRSNRGRDDDRERNNQDRDMRGNSGRNDREKSYTFGPEQFFPQLQFPSPQNEIRYIFNGIIQRVNGDERNGYVTVASNLDHRFGPAQMQTVTLVVSSATRLQNQNLRPMRFRDLRVGMTIFAAYSARMTRSIPPQATAYSIIAIMEEPFTVSTGTVAFVDPRNRTLVTGSIGNRNRQVVYNITDDTDIFNRFGQRIRLGQIRSGDRVRIKHATFQTASIPPQTTAFRIDIL